MIDVEATTSEDDLAIGDGKSLLSVAISRPCRDIHIPPGTMEADRFCAYGTTIGRSLVEVFIIELSAI